MNDTSNRRPVFIVSAPRSGSTLLRLILDAHPRLAFPPPGWLFHFVYPYLYSYGDLQKEENFRALVEDVLAAPTIQRWPIEADVEGVMSEVRERSFRGVYEYLHALYAARGGKPRWGEKTPRNSVWVDEIVSMFPDAQIVHLIRDGRDVGIDISDADFQPSTVYAGALVWLNFVRAIKRSAEKLDSGSYHEIRYEDLCGGPQEAISDLCGFLGEELSPAMLQHHQSNSTKSWSSDPRHAKTARPISDDYVDMYKTRLNDRERTELDASLGDTLRLFGYEVANNPQPLSDREASQLIEHDTVTAVDCFDYKNWHLSRRKERRARGVWSDKDKPSNLWGMN